MSTEQKLEQARARLERAQSAADVSFGRVGVPDDPGALSGVRRRSSSRQVSRDAASIDRSVEAALEVTRANDAVERLERQLAGEKRDAEIRARATCDVESLAPGDLIRYEKHGSVIGNVGRVLRVNKKTVTIEPRFEGHDAPKIQKARIVETRKEEDA